MEYWENDDMTHLPLHNTFVSYHHRNDQCFKDEFVEFGRCHGIFTDWSVNTGDISEALDSETIREIIRDDYLRSSTVTVLLAGTETKHRKHVDWELKSSMIDGPKNKRSGILVINLPTVNCSYFTAAHEGEKAVIYPDTTNWIGGLTRAEYEWRYPHLPDRIIDNLLAPKAAISVANWDTVMQDPLKLEYLIRVTAEGRHNCEYDLSRPMRRNNHTPHVRATLAAPIRY